jgi:hypothetical protein
MLTARGAGQCVRRGANCQLLVDDCGTGLFCTNGGTCQNLNNVQSGAICICPTGALCRMSKVQICHY